MWPVRTRHGDQGFTCCHATDLSDRIPAFDERVGYLFARGFARGNGKVLGQTTRIGLRPSDLVSGPLGTIWISDHAGLIVTLLLPSSASTE